MARTYMLSVNLSVTATREAAELLKAGSRGEESGVRGAPLGGLGGLREHPLHPPTPQLLSALRGPLWAKAMPGERKRDQSKNPNISDRQPVNKGAKATPTPGSSLPQQGAGHRMDTDRPGTSPAPAAQCQLGFVLVLRTGPQFLSNLRWPRGSGEQRGAAGSATSRAGGSESQPSPSP